MEVGSDHPVQGRREVLERIGRGSIGGPTGGGGCRGVRHWKKGGAPCEARCWEYDVIGGARLAGEKETDEHHGGTTAR